MYGEDYKGMSDGDDVTWQKVIRARNASKCAKYAKKYVKIG